MADTPTPPTAFDDCAYSGWATLGDGSPVAIAQDAPGQPLRWAVPDGRTTDGWREVTEKDAIGRLVADINTHQTAQAGPVTSGPGPDPVLVKGDNGASHIGTGLVPVMVGETGPEIVDLPEGTEITRPDEDDPTAGTTPDEDSED